MTRKLAPAAILSTTALLIAVPAFAEGAPPTAVAAPDIVITAPLSRSKEDVIAGTSVLGGEELARALKPTIGETLAHIPGVSATSFGPSASRPILRGFQGARIRVLTDGVGAFDVSNTSVDHAVVINPLLAERIEVVRGPSALLYGSEAIGGVVNVIDTRIPRSIPKDGYRLSGTATYGSAANERSGGAAADVAVGGGFVLHADGSYLKSGNLKIGGHALTRSLRNQALGTAAAGGDPDGEIDFAGNAAVKGELPNSQSKTWTAGVGASYVTDTGSIGFAYSHYDSLYGVPIRYATALDQEQEAPRLDLKQDRIDTRAGFDTGGTVLEQIRFRLGAARYRHFELEEDGSIGTAFYSQGMEGRLELAQAQHGAWRGVTGGQFSYRDFNVVGDEAFLPRNRSQNQGAFTLQQLGYGALKIEAGGRYEHATVTGLPIDQPQFLAGSRRFDLLSGSVGASYAFAEGFRIGVNVSHSERAPSAEELLANGPHGGTEAFEVGDPTLRKERANGIELVGHAHGKGWDLEASAYYQRFSNYVDEFATGTLEDGLPVYQTAQGRARYYGFEIEGSIDLAHFGDTKVKVDGLADYVHAQITDLGPAPRIPPMRFLGGVEASGGTVFGRVEAEHVMRQDRIAAYETETAGFTLFNASIGIKPFADHPNTTLTLTGNNLFDVNARRHASFLKDYAPLAGRDIRLTARFAI